MVKNSSLKFPILRGEKPLDGRCGDFAMVAENLVVQIIGYTNCGQDYLVKTSRGEIFQYVQVSRRKHE